MFFSRVSVLMNCSLELLISMFFFLPFTYSYPDRDFRHLQAWCKVWFTFLLLYAKGNMHDKEKKDEEHVFQTLPWDIFMKVLRS